MRSFTGFLLAACALSAQQQQSPSPMVEHTRPHPRLTDSKPPGQRLKLSIGSLFVPERLAKRKAVPLLVHFHGGTWLPEVAVARRGRTAVISIQLGSGSSTYSRPFAPAGRFLQLVSEAETQSGLHFTDVTLSGWSAGYGAIREILAQPAAYDRVAKVLLIDGMHTGYIDGHPGPLESRLEPEPLATFLRFARDAVAGRKQMIVIHSEIFPGTYASTTECADYLLKELGIPRAAHLAIGPMGMQQLSRVHRGGFVLAGYAGNSAPDHVDQLHSLAALLNWFRQ